MDTREKQLSLFKAPGAEYRGAPFWAWNTRMTRPLIARMLTAFQEMGMGGAHIHSRTGMDVPYLSREFFDLVKFSREESRKRGMYTYLYDEDRWASGFGGGYVTENHDYRLHFLVFSPISPEKFPIDAHDTEKAIFSGERKPLGRYAVTLKDGYLADYRMLTPEEVPDENEAEWFAWVETMGDTGWYNNQAYVDTLNPDAIKKFIDVTHEAYFREMGDGFGKDIPSIFTDEPQFATMTTFGYPDERRYHTMPYTDGFEAAYKAAYGESFLEHLPEIFYLQKDGRMSVRSYRYHDLLCELFARSYCDQIGTWCAQHGIAFTGHLFREDFLEGQTYAIGEAMRNYRAFQIPGIDVLSDHRRITTAKQVESASHQLGRKRIVSEMYGVTGWNFDFRGHKLAGDWQAALGITNRVHHVAWTTMRGAAKRDYPASIGPQSPWYKRYHMIEDYFARINTVTTTGRPIVRVGVIHPIESYWLYWGPNSQTADIRSEMDDRFVHFTSMLLFAAIDYDYISEGLLRDMPAQRDHAQFDVGDMSYDVVVVPACHTLRSTTLERLERYAASGGKIIFLEHKPFLEDAVESDRPAKLPGDVVPFSDTAIVRALEPWRTVSILDANGMRSSNLIYQLREADDCRWLFIAHVNHPVNCDIPRREDDTLSLAGHWRVERWDALTGETEVIHPSYTQTHTCWPLQGYAYDSFLYRLTPGRTADTSPAVCESTDADGEFLPLPAQCDYTLDEPNVLVLDYAEYRFDDEDWCPAEEMLRIGKKAKAHWNLPSESAQPWVYPEQTPAHTLHLRCRVSSQIPFTAQLAIENAAATSILWNGEPVLSRCDGYYVDPAIERIASPLTGKAGENILEISMPYGCRDSVENIFLLGSFGVQVSGRLAEIVSLPKKLTPTSLTTQLLPFYGGNITLHFPVKLCEEGALTVGATFFRCPAIDVSLDGVYRGTIAFAPYTCRIDKVPAGEHTVSLLLYGNRINTFGALHLADRKIAWKGDNMWFTTGAEWSDEYQLTECGLLKSPEIRFVPNKSTNA